MNTNIIDVVKADFSYEHQNSYSWEINMMADRMMSEAEAIA
jgi:hypothetical protein